MKSRVTPTTSRARLGERPTSSVPAKPDHGENSSSTLTEAPLPQPRADRLDAHDFPDGGGSGGAEAFSRRRTGKD